MVNSKTKTANFLFIELMEFHSIFVFGKLDIVNKNF